MTATARAAVWMLHGGIPCAIPVEHVDIADRLPPDPRDVVRLWDEVADRATQEAFERHLRVATVGGHRWVDGSDVRIVPLDPATTWALPPLVRAALRLPHVVALAQVGAEFAWLVDPNRLEGNETP